MKAYIKTSIFLISILFILSCSHKEQEDAIDITIKYGSECTCCRGQEYITITGFKVDYKRNIPCGENEGTTSKSKNITQQKWTAIADSFNYSLYSKHLNTMNVMFALTAVTKLYESQQMSLHTNYVILLQMKLRGWKMYRKSFLVY